MKQLITNLQHFEPEIDAGQIADILWLAQYIVIDCPFPQTDASSQLMGTELVVQKDELQDSFDSQVIDSAVSISKELDEVECDTDPKSNINAQSDTVLLTTSSSTQIVMGSSIRLAAAKSLRNPIKIERALRPFMQKVLSPFRQTLDEEATAELIAQTEMKMLVLKAEPQRWLDIALVVEETSLTEIWHKTINEFQELLEHLGAFRDVRVWSMRRNDTGSLELFPRHHRFLTQCRNHSPKELKDPSGQRLILFLSDCTSVSWWEGKVHTCLVEWAKVNLVTIVQLLPQRLWNRGILGEGLAVQLKTSVPAAPNWLWDIEGLPVWWSSEQIESLQIAITLPVTTLEPSALGQWARAVSGLEKVTTTGVLFKKDWQTSNLLSKVIQSQIGENHFAEPTAKNLVSHFQSTASPLARRLAILMAAAPVDLRIVELIQETMVPESLQVHIAEVYLGGLLIRKVDTLNKIYYDFKPGIRQELRKSLSQSEAFLVLNKVSAYIALRLGKEICSFTAFFLTDNFKTIQSDQEVLHFAEIALDVLQQMGGEYAYFANKVVQDRNPKSEQQIILENNNIQTSSDLKSLTQTIPEYDINTTKLETIHQYVEKISVGSDLTVIDIINIYREYNNLDNVPRPTVFPQNIPKSNTDKFVGREADLVQIHQYLEQNNALVISAVEGIGGVGKTELATQYCLLHLQANTRASARKKDAFYASEEVQLPVSEAYSWYSLQPVLSFA